MKFKDPNGGGYGNYCLSAKLTISDCIDKSIQLADRHDEIADLRSRMQALQEIVRTMAETLSQSQQAVLAQSLGFEVFDE